MDEDEDIFSDVDVCRVCRCEGAPHRQLFHPCVCTGSIKFIHQDCLMQWLKYSKKEKCEVCTHTFTFKPVYSPDMPKRLPLFDIFAGFVRTFGKATKCWFHYTLVAFAWFGVVPLVSCRIYRCLFTGSVSTLLTLPVDLLSTENIYSDCAKGGLVVMCSIGAFLGLVWLREQIMHGAGPDWLEAPVALANNNNNLDADAGLRQNADHADGRDPLDENAQNEEEEAEGEEEEEDEEVQNQQRPDDNHWNILDWDRGAEDMTWDRLLGLDGSFVFLEHVFWVASLNTLFILIFAFCPFHIGHYTIYGFRLEKFVQIIHFEGLITGLVGYLVIAVDLVLFYYVLALFGMERARKLVGICYIIVKVALLIVLEIGIFPLICGWWLDICSLGLFGVSLNDRIHSLSVAPATMLFIHWLVGMVYIFYFASFILILREILRPGVLWFLRNINDPDFNPIQEMIQLSVLRHGRRFLLSVVIFGLTVTLILWLPVRTIQYLLPNFLPYNVLPSSDAPFSELSLELLLLQVVVPALLEQGHTRVWIRVAVRGWAALIGSYLGLGSYLLGGSNEHVAANLPNPDPNNLGAAHLALVQPTVREEALPYVKPKYFVLRVALLLGIMSTTIHTVSFVALTLPVFFGRQVLYYFFGAGVHELYTAGFGLYICWLIIRIVTMVNAWLNLGLEAVAKKLGEWISLALKCAVLAGFVVGLVPLLLGYLFTEVVVVPLRVALNQSPLYFPWQDWAIGILHLKIICAIVMMGPRWWLRDNLDRVYQEGIRRLDVVFVIRHIVAPFLMRLGLAISLPYVLAHSFCPLIVSHSDTLVLVQRRVYPFCLFSMLATALVVFQVTQCKRLYEHIRNDKYLIGRVLVNYERPRAPASQ